MSTISGVNRDEFKIATGKRIKLSRKAAGFTIKELAARTVEFKTARICNWEHGIRTPGAYEATILAKVLDVSASYLMCLNDKEGREEASMEAIPILTSMQALRVRSKLRELFFSNLESSDKFERIPLDKNLSNRLSDDAFAMVIEDMSMAPEFAMGDVIIVDPAVQPKPGGYVIAEVKPRDTVLFRKFRESSDGFELLPLNPDWASISVKSEDDGRVIATIVEHRRLF